MQIVNINRPGFRKSAIILALVRNSSAGNVYKHKGKLIDRVRIYCRGGGGGQGIARHGAIGGDGGDVYIKAKEGASLTEIAKLESKRFIAVNGENCSRNTLQGRKGEDRTVVVPVGTSVSCLDSGKLITSLEEPGSSILVSKGGSGGCQITNSKWSGLRGRPRLLLLQLQIIADVGLIGFPNAGKSTLLRALSSAQPKVANYPFTTIRPHLGVITYSYPDHTKITIADLPGLVEGASQNAGMGHKFLKHAERTKLLLYVIDVNGFQLSDRFRYRTPFECITLLAQELTEYSDELFQRPTIIVINKMDIKDSKSKLDQLTNAINRSQLGDSKILPNYLKLCPISAKERTGIDELKSELYLHIV